MSLSLLLFDILLGFRENRDLVGNIDNAFLMWGWTRETKIAFDFCGKKTPRNFKDYSLLILLDTTLRNHISKFIIVDPEFV